MNLVKFGHTLGSLLFILIKRLLSCTIRVWEVDISETGADYLMHSTSLVINTIAFI